MVGKKKIIECGNVRFIRKTVSKSERKPLKKNRAPKAKKTTESHERSNKRAAQDKLRILVQNNFTGNDLFITLTYNGNEPITPAKQKKELENFLRRLNYYYKKTRKELKYVASMERVDVRPHNHLIINHVEGMGKDIIERVWGCGNVDIRRLPDQACFMDLSDYLIKESTNPDKAEKREFSHAWKKSRNVTLPEEEVETFRLDSSGEAVDFLEIKPDPGFRLVSHSEVDGLVPLTDVGYAKYIEIK